MTVRVEELQNWHIEAIKPRSVYRNEPLDLKGLVGNDKIFASAVVQGEVVLAIIGGTIQWEGVAHCWAIISDSIKNCPVEFHKKVKWLIESTFTGINLHRLEATVKADFSMGIRWLNSLGFEYEGTLRQYGVDRSDYQLFARYK